MWWWECVYVYLQQLSHNRRQIYIIWTFVGKDIPKNVLWGQIREGERQNQAFIKEFILVFSVTM